MRNDIGSNYLLVTALSSAVVSVGTAVSSAIDHADAGSGSFLIDVSVVGASATIDAKLQYSDDNASWTDVPVDDLARNDWAITQITVAGSAVLNVPNPRGRYSRVEVTVGVADSTVGISSVAGPLRHQVAFT